MKPKFKLHTDGRMSLLRPGQQAAPPRPDAAEYADRARRAKALFRMTGVSTNRWAKANGFSHELVHQVLNTNRACAHGQSHVIAVMLGLKDGPVGYTAEDVTRELRRLNQGSAHAGLEGEADEAHGSAAQRWADDAGPSEQSSAQEFAARVLRLKECLGLCEDQQIAKALGITPPALSARKKRGAFPDGRVAALKTRFPDLDVHYVLTGQRTPQA